MTWKDWPSLRYLAVIPSLVAGLGAVWIVWAYGTTSGTCDGPVLPIRAFGLVGMVLSAALALLPALTVWWLHRRRLMGRIATAVSLAVCVLPMLACAYAYWVARVMHRELYGM